MTTKKPKPKKTRRHRFHPRQVARKLNGGVHVLVYAGDDTIAEVHVEVQLLKPPKEMQPAVAHVIGQTLRHFFFREVFPDAPSTPAGPPAESPK